MELPHPHVAVIIPTYNDTRRLKRCLTALAAQSYPADRITIIVVDNGSSTPVCKEINSPRSLRCFVEQAPGSYAARNRGLAEAHQPIVAFTDSDCLPDRHWILRGVDALLAAGDECGVVAGEVKLFFKGKSPTTIAEAYEYLFEFRYPSSQVLRKCVTANWFSRRETIESFGGFNQGLYSNGDTELSTRISAAGLKIMYEPSAQVYHPARHRMMLLIRKRRRLVGGDLLRHRGQRRSTSRITLGNSAKTYFGRVRSLLTIGSADFTKSVRLKGLFALSVLFAVTVFEVIRVRAFHCTAQR